MTHHKLVIAEKPAVAQSIAAVLGATKRNDGYLSGNGYLVSWCFGHLAELAGADVYDEKYAKWRYDDLPILPASWRFTLKADKAKQFELLWDLMRREDVTEVINACDAGREGELIFRTVYYMAGCTKTMKRLWISSMEDEAIRKGFADLRPGREYDGLHQSALCRARADWLVGINATRLFSVLYHRTLNVGRVMTPTLALIVQREAEIGAFRPEAFYTVNLRCGDFAAVSEKFKEKAEADALAAACAGQPVTVRTVQRTEKTENAPRLYDLTALQREANRSLGYTAQQTLDYLQALYAEIKALCAGDERIREKMDLDVDVARLRLMKANHQSQQYRLEDNILRHFPAQIEENKGFLSGFEADMKMLEQHPHPKDGFAGMEVKGDLLTDKDNAGAAILEAFKDAKGLESVPIGSYRGFSMSLTVENFGKDFILTLKGKMSHRVELGKDARGNLVRIDNALAQMPERYKTVQGRLENVQAQLATAKAELGKPFPQEAELKEKSARLAELNAELNIDDRTPMEQAAENVVAKRPSVLGKLKAPCVHGAGEKKKSHEQEAR